jgi:hypothetical protein
LFLIKKKSFYLFFLALAFFGERKECWMFMGRDGPGGTIVNGLRRGVFGYFIYLFKKKEKK